MYLNKKKEEKFEQTEYIIDSNKKPSVIVVADDFNERTGREMGAKLQNQENFRLEA